MKKMFLLLAVVGTAILSSCEGDRGPQGPAGTNIESEVFELRNVDFTFDNAEGYIIRNNLNPQILLADNILIYRMTGTIDSNTPIWQLIPRTLFLQDGNELDYDYDFSRIDFTIYAGGTYNLALTPEYIDNQTFRIVIIPGFLSNKGTKIVDTNDYNAVIDYYGINDKKIKLLN